MMNVSYSKVVRLLVWCGCVGWTASMTLSTTLPSVPTTTYYFTGTSAMRSNPERGFRHEIDQGCDRGGITDAQIAQMVQNNLTVSQVYCYLPVNDTLTPQVFQSVQAAFDKLRSAGVKALWRFAYDRDMPGENDYTTETIVNHIAQLKDKFSTNIDAVYVLQAGFIGSWGEWHSSKRNIHLNATATSLIVEAELFELLPPDRKINVRVPVYKLGGVLRRAALPPRPSSPDSNSTRCHGLSPFPIPIQECRGAFGGINASQCEALGCCFNSSVPGVAFCRVPSFQLSFVVNRNQSSPSSPSSSSSSSVPVGMDFGVLSGDIAKGNTALARIGYDNDGFMSTLDDGGTFGNQFFNPSWASAGAPFPQLGTQLSSSRATPIFDTGHGPAVDSDYTYVKQESAWVPVDGEMFWNVGAKVYDPQWPKIIGGETAAWRLRELHYTTLSFVHGYLDTTPALAKNETIGVWMNTTLDIARLIEDRLPISPAYASTPHSQYEYIRDHLGYRLELQSATYPPLFNLTSAGPQIAWNFSASLVNWGFAAPINPRPVLLVLLAVDHKTILWTSETSIADVRDWQPFTPGDPTYTPVIYSFGAEYTIPTNISLLCLQASQGNQQSSSSPSSLPSSSSCDLSIGILMPDERMTNLGASPASAAAYSIRFANDDIDWVPIVGVGAVNVLGNISIVSSLESNSRL
eukprot:m.222177 g.222177  ORF g.222177 m.222177 type:complete len:689 (-) comp33365_c0_seq1:650-2716(-)